MKEINIGKTIYSKRKEKGITQDELADYMGVSKASVSKWENGQSYPDITFLPILATFFNISVDELIGYLPQMSLQDVKKLYNKLSEMFTDKSYETVLNSIHHYMKKYYSCYILQYYMAILLLNYGVTTNDSKLKESMIHEAYEVCERIISECDELKLSNQALSLQATAALLMNQPKQVIALLEDQIEPQDNNQQILANAYLMNGQPDKAAEITQFTIFGNLVNMLSELQGYLAMNTQNKELFEDILNKCVSVAKTFNVEVIHQNVMAQIYLTAAGGYMMHADQEKAIHMLQQYADVCEKIEYPVRLHGDHFFTLIDDMLDEFEVGTVSPRNELAIRQSIVVVVSGNPVFQPLSEDKEYKRIIARLSKGL